MKLLVTGDLHVSDRRVLGRPRLPVTLDMLQFVFDLAVSQRADALVLNGDVIDQKLGFPIDVYLGILAVFERNSDVKAYWIRGNHESPDAERPQRTLMRLFEGLVSTVIDRPVYLSDDASTVWLAPWWPAEKFKQSISEVAAQVRSTKKNYLITHVGLKEGTTGPSNFHPPSEVRAKDLHPSKFARILLGDYHKHQWIVEDKVCYLGAPIEHTFGDDPSPGVWLLDTVENTLVPVPLIGFPRFRQWQIDTPKKLERLRDAIKTRPGIFSQEDYHRAYTTPALYDLVVGLLPFADVRTVVKDAEVAVSESSRISVLPGVTPEMSIHRWLDYKQIHDEAERTRLVELGLEILKASKENK